MEATYLYSLVLEMQALNTVVLEHAIGHQVHAMFLDLVRQTQPELATRLHDEPSYRPFTLSQIQGPEAVSKARAFPVKEGQLYRIRVTLLDGGGLWQHLSSHFMESHGLQVHVGPAILQMQRVLASSEADASGWARSGRWQDLANVSPQHTVNLRFASPTAFSLGDRQFALFPEPHLVWDSLIRSWNLYAPEALQIEKQPLREVIKQGVIVNDYDLRTTRFALQNHIQKGFVGTCSYTIRVENEYVTQLAALAEFAWYAGIGYKTTMGMGQARIEK